MNKIIIVGNLCSDPEAFTTQSGIARSTFRVAVQRRTKNAEGKYDADFFTVVAWRTAADFCNRYLSKGRKVCVEGQVQNRSYDAQDGSKRWVTEVIVDHIEALNSGNADPGPTPPPTKKDEAKPAQGDGFTEVEDDELPF